MKETNKNDQIQSPSEQEWEVIEMLRRHGLISPRTEKQTLRYIDDIESNPPILPDDLADYEQAVEKIFGSPIVLKHRHDAGYANEEQISSLRRAARNGKEIPSDIEEAMRRARETNDEE